MTRSTKFRFLAAVAVMVGLLAPLLGPAALPASAVSDVTTERIGGADRFETAANVARKSHAGAETALIANGLNFPDALAGSTLAGVVNAPILLVTPGSIPASTSAALSGIGVNDVVILGGPAAVSPQVEAQLRQNYGVTRVEGADRYQTAVAIARRAAVGGVGTVDGLRTAFVSTGLNFPDALGAGPLAYESNLPSFLTRTNDLPPEVAQAIRDLNIEHVVILGGTQAVTTNVENQLEALGVSTERLAGRNRAETATFVADFALARLDFEGVNVILARGDNFPDALAGGPLGGERRAVILLTATPCQLAIETREWLEAHYGTVARIIVLGGPSAVCDAVVREAEAAAETNNLPPSQVALTISGGSMNGGPKWQYQQSGASPSKSLQLSAFVSSDPPEGSDDEAERVPAGREDVIFNIKPTPGDHASNTELNLTARTDSNGVARVSYTRSQPGTDIITVRLRDDTSVMDDGVGRWNTEAMPLSLAPDTAASLPVNQFREFTLCDPGPEGGPTVQGVQYNLTTLELVDEDPTNDTNVAALRFEGDVVTDDRADNDQTIGKVTTAAPDGCVTFGVSSNAAQIFTLMAFLDNINTPAANDDNTNPPEYRDIAGPTAFGSTSEGLNITPANDNDSDTAVTRRNGQQIVYTVTAVDAQGQPLSGPIDVSFEQLTDGQPATTTTAEFDWFDNSASPSTQEGSTNQVPPGATATPAGTTRIEVIPNTQGVFTFAITHPANRTFGTSGNPIAWIDIPGGTNNRPDSTEPQARGENFEFNTGTAAFEYATLETLGCPPGVPERGTPPADPSATDLSGEIGNPDTVQDPCLGRDVLEDDPHVPWPLTVAAVSDEADASTAQPGTMSVTSEPGEPNPATISRGDITVRWTFRDATGRPKTPPGNGVLTEFVDASVCFVVLEDGRPFSENVDQEPNRPNPGSDGAPSASPTSPFCQAFGESLGATPEEIVEVTTSDPYAEMVVDGGDATTADIHAAALSNDSTNFCPFGGTPPADPATCEFVATVAWVGVSTDTTDDATIPPTSEAPDLQCPSPSQPCFNGNLVSIDKARDYYVMNRGAISGGTAYVVYAVGGGGELYTATTGERPDGSDQYFINGLPSPPDLDDNERCGFWNTGGTQSGCARFDAALSFDDRMVYEYSEAPPRRTQTHFLTDGNA